MALVVQGGVTLVGRGSTFLVNEGEGLRVKMSSPLASRLQNMREFYGTEAKAAQAQLARRDKERAQFVRQHFGADLADLANFDLAINLERLTPDAAADTILEALEHLQS